MKVMLAGPIKHWWDCWDSPEHVAYVRWRQTLSDALVEAGHLVYRPHEAWKGQWDESAQAVNDTAMQVVDVVLNLTPPGVPSLGTDDEVDYARRYNKVVVDAPPPEINYGYAAIEFIRQLEANVELARTRASVDTVARKLLWAIEGGHTLDDGQVRDIVQEARDALGENTVLR